MHGLVSRLFLGEMSRTRTVGPPGFVLVLYDDLAQPRGKAVVVVVDDGLANV